MKFDMKLQMKNNEAIPALKIQWGEARPVVIIASTHEDEEKQWLSRLAQLKQGITNVLLVVVPRHPERFKTVYEASLALGLKTNLRSASDAIDFSTEVVIVDAMGELMQFYQVSDYAFVGGSLVPIGGHNVLEPIAVKVPVFCGPYMNNSKAICQELCNAGALVMGKGVDDLIEKMIALHQHKKDRALQVANASKVLEANRGTVIRYMDEIEGALALSGGPDIEQASI